MARFWRCVRCGTLQNTVGLFTSEPEECDECSHDEFEIIGVKRAGFVERVVGNLSVARAVRLLVGLGALNFIVTILLALFDQSAIVLGFGGLNLVLLLLLAYGLTKKSLAVWGLSVLLMGLATAGAVVTLVGLVLATVGTAVAGFDGILVTGVLTALYLVYSLIYVAILANLLGGREEFFAERTA